MTRMILSPDAGHTRAAETGSMTTPPAVAPRSLVGRIFTYLFVTIGVLASIAALLAGGIAWAFASGDVPAENARDGFADYADGMTGVASVTANVGSSDMQQPFNVDATVTLDEGCSIDELERTVGRTARHLAGTDGEVQVHPVVVCGDLSVGVSPVAKVTSERMALLRELLALADATGAAVVFPQPGYDRFVDSSNDGVTLAVRVATRDALVPTTRQLLAHPPLDVSLATVVVDAGSADRSGLVDYYAGSLASRISVTGNTATLDQLLGAIDALNATTLRTAATVSTSETTLEIEVATAADARAANAVLAGSGADATGATVTVRPPE
jgi:hypothetical protein